MLTVTERAAEEVEELLRVNNAAPGQGVKLVPSLTGDIGLAIDTPGEGDEVIRSKDDLTLLIVDRHIAGGLEGKKIDCITSVVDGQPRTEFKLLHAA